MRRVVLDNEAVQALIGPQHPKHRRVVAHLAVVAGRKRKAIPISAVVPTTVRVEAGWDRTAAAWSLANRLRVVDVDLTTDQANAAAAIRSGVGTNISVTDAHLGAVIDSFATTTSPCSPAIRTTSAWSPARPRWSSSRSDLSPAPCAFRRRPSTSWFLIRRNLGESWTRDRPGWAD